MDVYNSEYWIVVMIMQRLSGTWYRQKKWQNIVMRIYVYASAASIATAIGLKLIEEWGHDWEICIENIIGEMYLTFTTLKLTVSLIEEEKFQNIFQRIAEDWTKIKDKDEKDILKRYAIIGRNNSLVYAVIMICLISSFLLLPVTTVVEDIIFPLENGTRPRIYPYNAEFGVDIDEHYFELLAYAAISGLSTIIAIVSFDITFGMYGQHVAGLFAIVNYRLERAGEMTEAIDRGDVDREKGQEYAHRFIVRAIDLHQDVYDYIDVIEDCFSSTWLIVHVINMGIFGGGLVVTIMKWPKIRETLRYCSTMSAILIHFYYTFLPGQKMIDSSEGVFNFCYGCKWYNFSPRTRPLIKLMQLRSSKPSELTGGKMFPLCMETYCNMMKTGFSIYTLLNQTA